MHVCLCVHPCACMCGWVVRCVCMCVCVCIHVHACVGAVLTTVKAFTFS